VLFLWHPFVFRAMFVCLTNNTHNMFLKHPLRENILFSGVHLIFHLWLARMLYVIPNAFLLPPLFAARAGRSSPSFCAPRPARHFVGVSAETMYPFILAHYPLEHCVSRPLIVLLIGSNLLLWCLWGQGGECWGRVSFFLLLFLRLLWCGHNPP